jgi:hypothetical protein
VDDFLGTGYQFQRFFRRLQGAHDFSGKRLIYAPLIAHRRGMNRLGRNIPQVEIAFAEQIDDEYNLFGGISGDGVNSRDDTYAFYNSFLSSRKLDLLPRKVLGYGKLGLCLAFEHATPNSTLPLLWLGRAGFTPLFKR